MNTEGRHSSKEGLHSGSKAGKSGDDTGIKNPEGEAENPAPMPISGYGGGATRDSIVDPGGQQGATRGKD